MDDNVLHEISSMHSTLKLESLQDHLLIRIDTLYLALDYSVYDEHRLDDYHSVNGRFVRKKEIMYSLTKTPFISLKTTPLITIGEDGSLVFSCSSRQPSCLKRQNRTCQSLHRCSSINYIKSNSSNFGWRTASR